MQEGDSVTPHTSTTVDKGDAGYDKALKNRHLQMIAIGGSIGTGLFLGYWRTPCPRWPRIGDKLRRLWHLRLPHGEGPR